MDYSSFTVKKLRELCQKEGLPTKGNKKELIDGLEGLQMSAIELIAAEVPEDDLTAPEPDSPIAPAPAAVDTTMAPAPIPALDPAPVLENASSQPAAPAIRASTRVIRPRICTMCVGCHHHPTHAAGRAPRKAATAPVDEASIVDLAQKFATVNIVPEQPQQQEEQGNGPVLEAAVPAKISAKSTRTRTVSTTRAPLKAKSNQASVETAAAAEANAKSAKSTKGKVTITKKKVVSGKVRAAAAAPETEKENLPAVIDEAKVTTDRPGRRTRFVKNC